jgi:alpha-tubulin suppressor-like RCC1 family protein
MAVGDTVVLAARAADAAGAALPGVRFSWSSSDTTVATVDSTGLLTARAMGTVTVTATLIGPRDFVNRTTSASTTLRVRLVFASISAGSQHACGIARNGVAYCWGLQDWGRIGNGADAGNALRPVRVSSADRFTVISAGIDHTCGITTTAELACWGSGAYGKLGDGEHGEGIPPHRVLLPRHFGQRGFTDVVAQNTHTCALTTSGDVYCAGSNYAHQLGVDTVTSVCGQDMPGTPFLESCSPTFVKVAGAPAFTKLFGLGGTTCGRTASRATFCWGQNGGGAGVGYLDAVATPTPILGGIDFAAVSGITSYACGLATTGAMYCWGSNQFGELGTGAASINMTLAPVRAAGPMTFTAMGAGGAAFRAHACGVTTGGDVYCWGAGMDGVLGFPAAETCGPQAMNGAGPCATQPTRVPGLPTLASIAVGGTFTCGLTPTGTAYCWGNSSGGQLGNGAASGTGIAPVRVIDTN